MAKRKRTRSKVVKDLDTVFSQYIRRKDAKNEIATCVTCDKQDHWKKLQAGHFQSRKHYATRWNEDNVKVQCAACNVFRYGEQFKFGKWLDNIKKGLSDELATKAKQIVKFSTAELEEMIDIYKNKIKEL